MARHAEHGPALVRALASPSVSILQPLLGNAFSVLAELRRCGVSESETCLKSVTLTLGAGQTVSGCPLGWPQTPTARTGLSL